MSKKYSTSKNLSTIVEDIDNDNVNVFDQNNPTNNNEINPSDLSKEDAEVDIEVEPDKKIEIDPKEEFDKNNENKQ